VKVAGSGHSFTDIACTDGVMIDMSGMTRVLGVDDNEVTVEAGITLHHLGDGAALAGTGDGEPGRRGPADAGRRRSPRPRMAPGAGFGNLSSQVVGLRLVDGTGQVRELRDGDELRAARVSLGALGAISAVTLRCVPAFTIHRIDKPRPLEDVLGRFDEYVDAHDHWEAFVMPYTRRALTLTSERTDREPEPRGRAAAFMNDVVLENAVLGAFCRTGRAFQRLIPSLNRTLARLLSGSEHLDASNRVYANVRLVRFTEMEYALPREHATEALERVLAMIERRRLPVGFPIELRVTAPDDALLSTAHGRPTAYIAVHQYVGMEFETYFRAVEQVMDEYDGRPHWGKRHYQTAATLRPRYPEWDRFIEIRDRLDPERRFENDYLRRVLTGSGAASGPA
jgi:L-gulonolactone oxidase